MVRLTMHVLFVIHQFLPKHVAGSEIYTHNLAKTLQERGHKVAVYTREFGYSERTFSEEDIDHAGIKVKRIYFNPHNEKSYRFRNFCNDFYNPLIENHFREYLRNARPDIVHIQHLRGLSGGFIDIVRKHKIPTVLTAHDFWFMCTTIQLFTPSSRRCSGPFYGLKCPACVKSSHHRLVNWGSYPFRAALFFKRSIYLKRILNQVDLVISPSEFLRKKLIQYGLSEDKIRFCDNGIATQLLVPRKRKIRKKVRFAFMGSIMRHKGVHILIDAFNKIPDTQAELCVYGDLTYSPDYYKELNLMVRNPDIKFMGRFNNDDVFEILNEVDVLVVPSIWYENSPLTIHEATLANVPIITSNIGGMAELINRFGSGLLFEVENAEDLSKKMRLLISKHELRQELTGKASQIKTMYQNANELEQIYSNLLQR